MVAERVVGATHAASAEFPLACEHLERTRTLYEPQAHGSLAFEYAQDPAVTALAYQSTTLWMLGFPDQARDKMNDAERYARELAHPHTLVYLLMCGKSWLQMLLRDSATTRRYAAESNSIATEQAFPYWSAYAKIVGGWATAHQDDSRAGIAAIAAGIRQYRSTGSALFLPTFLWALADAHRMADDADEGLTAIRDGLAAAEGSGELWWHAELHRLRGVLILESRRDVKKEAEDAFHAAITISRNQGARSWELRAATSFARLWQSQGKIDEAYDLLAPVYAWFTEGFNTADLKEAKGLLEELK